jgi:hypothetical protein
MFYDLRSQALLARIYANNIFGGLKLQSKRFTKLNILDVGGDSETSQKTDSFAANAMKTSNLAERRDIRSNICYKFVMYVGVSY